jgi:hypothetical protein
MTVQSPSSHAARTSRPARAAGGRHRAGRQRSSPLQLSLLTKAGLVAVAPLVGAGLLGGVSPAQASPTSVSNTTIAQSESDAWYYQAGVRQGLLIGGGVGLALGASLVGLTALTFGAAASRGASDAYERGRKAGRKEVVDEYHRGESGIGADAWREGHRYGYQEGWHARGQQSP